MPPELPEVETFVRGLASAVGRTIASAEVLDTRLAVVPEELAGARIAAIERRGKYIRIEFTDGRKLVIHLRMSGRLRLDCEGNECQYVRIVLHLDNGEKVYFIDPRRLGTADVCEDSGDSPVGVEPLGSQFTKEALGELAGRSRAPIKSLLLDQRKIGGLGNIYAAEALWRARVDPRRRADELSGRRGQIFTLGFFCPQRHALVFPSRALLSRTSERRATRLERAPGRVNPPNHTRHVKISYLASSLTKLVALWSDRRMESASVGSLPLFLSDMSDALSEPSDSFVFAPPVLFLPCLVPFWRVRCRFPTSRNRYRIIT